MFSGKGMTPEQYANLRGQYSPEPDPVKHELPRLAQQLSYALAHPDYQTKDELERLAAMRLSLVEQGVEEGHLRSVDMLLAELTDIISPISLPNSDSANK